MRGTRRSLSADSLPFVAHSGVKVGHGDPLALTVGVLHIDLVRLRRPHHKVVRLGLLLHLIGCGDPCQLLLRARERVEDAVDERWGRVRRPRALWSRVCHGNGSKYGFATTIVPRA